VEAVTEVEQQAPLAAVQQQLVAADFPDAAVAGQGRSIARINPSIT